ncbi:MAG: tetratricopeptide repeat protein [Hyphomicrobiales bacterium]
MSIFKGSAVFMGSALLAVGLIAGSPALLSTGALAAGDDPCDKYQQGSDSWKKCMGIKAIPENPGTDDEIYHAGYWLATNGRYKAAIDMLYRAENQNDPRILNYLGFAHRKLGKVEEGLSYYRRALAIKPDYVLAREYMGEAFLQIGNIAAAQNQLSEIEKRCGTACPSYVELAGLIKSAKL